MRGEVAAVPRVFGVFDHQALVLGDLETPDPSHQLGTARAEGQVRCRPEEGARTHPPKQGTSPPSRGTHRPTDRRTDQ